jgi:hypothetical protein
MKVVGFWLEGRAIPLEKPMKTPAVPGDIVEEKGSYYRVFSDGRYYRYALVNQEWQAAIEQFIPSGSELDVKGRGW